MTQFIYTDKELEDMPLWQLGLKVSIHEPLLTSKIDVVLAKRVKDMRDVFGSYYWISNSKYVDLLPHFCRKINIFLKEELEKNNLQDCLWLFNKLSVWVNNEILQVLVEKWLKQEEPCNLDWWVVDRCNLTSENGPDVLGKIVKFYKYKKSIRNIKLIEYIFSNINKNYIEGACEKIKESTPAVQACLLTRNDIPEKYILVGLKALSKLSRQRNVNIKIDLNLLSHLGPKSRLDVMKQLLGMFDSYYKWEQKKRKSPDKYLYSNRKTNKDFESPFEKIPDRDEVQRFLFPCSLKYNEEVVDLMERFDNFFTTKEEDNGKCI